MSSGQCAGSHLASGLTQCQGRAQSAGFRNPRVPVAALGGPGGNGSSGATRQPTIGHQRGAIHSPNPWEPCVALRPLFGCSAPTDGSAMTLREAPGPGMHRTPSARMDAGLCGMMHSWPSRGLPGMASGATGFRGPPCGGALFHGGSGLRRQLRGPCIVGAGGATAAAVTVSAHKPKDMYADLARYGIMDDFDMAPMPFFSSSSSSTLAPPAPGVGPSSPTLLPKGVPGRPRTRAPAEVEAEVEAPSWAKSSSRFSDDRGNGAQEGLTSELSAAAIQAQAEAARGGGSAAEGGSSGKGASSFAFDEAGPGTWCVYLLLAADEKKTYVGVTNDVERRLKQHNGEIVGGAKTTKAGRPWKLLCSVSGFQTRSEAFQFEWRWKNPRAIKGDGSFDRGSMAPSAQILREREAAAAAANAGGRGPAVPLVVERRRASLEEALRSFPKWRFLQVNWSDSFR